MYTFVNYSRQNDICFINRRYNLIQYRCSPIINIIIIVDLQVLV